MAVRVLLVHTHPVADSFVAAMRDVFVEEFTAQGAEIHVSDLYKQNFDPVLSAADFKAPADPDRLVIGLEQRRGFADGTLADDIAAEVEQVLAADVIVFTFPLFWYGPPAMLKGWIERVFLSGPIYGGKRVYGRGGLAGKHALVAFSLGGRPHMFGPGALHGELETGMLRHFLQGTLGYAGLTVHRPFVAYHVPYVGDDDRRAMLDELRDYVRNWRAQEVMPMPDLDNYDATFAPRGEAKP